MAKNNKRAALLLVLSLAIAPLRATALAESGLDGIVSGWMDQIELASGVTVSWQDALRIAAETLMHMGYETAETLAEYEISSDRPKQGYENNWLVNLQPREGATRAEELYSVEVDARNGHVVAIGIGPHYQPAGDGAPTSVPTERQAAMEAAVDAQDVATLAGQLAQKNLVSTAQGMPQPMEGTDFAALSTQDMDRQDVLEAALEAAVTDEGFTVAQLRDYRANFVLTQDASGARVWTVRLYPPELAAQPYIKAAVDAKTGVVLSFIRTEPKEDGVWALEDEETYAALIAYWKAHEYANFELLSADGFNGRPEADEVQLEEALRAAVDAVFRLSGLPAEALYAFLPNTNFFDRNTAMEGMGHEQRAWFFSFGNVVDNAIPGLINVTIDAETGEVTDVVLAHSQHVFPTLFLEDQLLENESLARVVAGWVEQNGGAAFPVVKDPLEGLNIYYYSRAEEYGVPDARDCSREAALLAALDAIAKLEDVPPEALENAVPTIRYNSIRSDRRHYVIDVQAEKRYIVEVESPSARLMRILMDKVETE